MDWGEGDAAVVREYKVTALTPAFFIGAVIVFYTMRYSV